jgi:putative phosphoribosyl transferase
MTSFASERQDKPVTIPADHVTLEGNLNIPDGANGLVVFAHGSGSSRHNPRNRFVASVLREAGLGTLLTDLLSLREEERDLETAELRFDIELLARRLVAATDWILGSQQIRAPNIGYFGASTGAAAALVAAALRPSAVGAVVSRGGRPDLAARSLSQITAPTLLIVGGRDTPVIEMNREAFEHLHLFEEPGTLEVVAQHATRWFQRHLRTEESDPSQGVATT